MIQKVSNNKLYVKCFTMYQGLSFKINLRISKVASYLVSFILFLNINLIFLYLNLDWEFHILFTLMCLSIGTPKNNKLSICPKWKIHYFQMSQNLGRVQPHYYVLEYSDT